ncbi:MAG: hypothetical protein D6782_09345 [Alphaproteobacteria bacterium]|nr:MAG: hypothetical protein D6782_09345 [Alphaproteobacteria bacterium]
MRSFLARRALDAFAARYDYDVGYLRHMLDLAPAAFAKFGALTALAQFRQAVPAASFYAAKLAGALAEDCGPCTQLVVDMAREAGVAAGEIEAVLQHRPSAMALETAIAFRFADALLCRAAALEDARESVRACWGDAGVLDLTLALQIGRVFPMVKAGLGFAKACRRVHIDGRVVEVAAKAA